MDKRIALTDYIELDGQDLSNSFRSVAYTSDRDNIDVSGFNEDGFSEFLAGSRVIQIEMEMFVTRGSNEAWQTLYPLHRDDVQFDLVWRAHGEDQASSTNPELRGSVKILNWPAGGTRGDIETGTVTFVPSDIAAPLEFVRNLMDRIVVNIRPYVGEYDFDIEAEPLTTLEWRWVKKISGYLPMTLDEGLRGGDPDLFVAFAVIALSRAGKIQRTEAYTVADRLSDAPFDGASIQYVGDEPEAVEGDPPAEPAVTPDLSGGESSSTTSDPQVSDPSPTGHPGSETSANSARLTSVG